MHRLLSVYVIFFLLVGSLPVSAATIYLRDKTRIEATITGETAMEFHIQKAGKNYSFAYMQPYDSINKADVFCIMDEKGNIKYPTLLPPSSPGGGLGTKELSPAEFQAILLQDQRREMQQMNNHLGTIVTIMFIEFIVAVAGGVIIASQ
jgi:hypothetical protein